MPTKSICYSCGADIETAGKDLPCPRCGKFTGMPAASSANQNTIIESPGVSGASSPVVRTRPDECPRSIDGFEIMSILGYGGMGTVFLAYEPLLDREVALKLLGRCDDEKVRDHLASRFLAETVLTGKLGHAGIVPIYHVGFDPAHGYYYTMRYVKGETLGSVLQRLRAGDSLTKERYSPTRLLNIFQKVCEALGFAHVHNVVHRDIKPDNIMIADFGEVLVLDWGLAKQTREAEISTAMAIDQNRSRENSANRTLRSRHDTSSQLFLLKGKKPTGNSSYLKLLQTARPDKNRPQTEANQILGTPGYLSPEQGMGLANVTPASDVYSLGIMLYEILTLHRPLDCADTQDIIANTVLGKIVPIRSRPEAFRLPVALCDVVNRALELNPEDRFASGKELADEVAAYLEGKAPFKTVLRESFSVARLSPSWQVAAGDVEIKDGAAWISPEARLQCAKGCDGDFRCECHFWSASDAVRWVFKLNVLEETLQREGAARYELRVGIQERSFIELIRHGKRVLRRFDIGIQSNQKYSLKLELEEERLRVWIEGRKVVDYNERFPQTGGAIELSAAEAQVCAGDLHLTSRGAPLHLSFMAIPDRLYRRNKFNEARELYRQLASSHPDREEGLIALYKAGLCSTAIEDLHAAFDEFSRLEGTMLDHCCALGLAKIGLCDGNIDWAWEALKNGYRRHNADDIRSEMWFSLLSLVENFDASRSEEKLSRYMELLTELNAESHETSQLTFSIMELIQSRRDITYLRSQAKTLLEKFAKNPYVEAEVLLALSRAGLNESLLSPVSEAVDRILCGKLSSSQKARFFILRAETFIAQRNVVHADQFLRNAVIEVGLMNRHGLWARGWQILLLCLQQDYQQALTGAHELLVRCKRMQCQEVHYVRLLEGLAYLGKGQNLQAFSAFRSALEMNSIWSEAARCIVEKQPVEDLVNACSGSSPALLSEALFLIAEANRMLGFNELATGYYLSCLKSPLDRAMFAGLARSALAEMGLGINAMSERTAR